MISALFAKMKKETPIHLFWTCNATTLFWHGFKQWLDKRTQHLIPIKFSPSLALALSPDPLLHKHLNFYFLVASFFIWVCKMHNILPKIENFSLSFHITTQQKPSLNVHSSRKPCKYIQCSFHPFLSFNI